MIADAFAVTLAAIALWHIYRLDKLSEAHEARIKVLERREPEKRVVAPVQAAYEKPVVKNSKEVKPLEIGDGRMKFDPEAQVAEWI